MRLIKQNIERDGSGSVTLFPEEPEDMVCYPATTCSLPSKTPVPTRTLRPTLLCPLLIDSLTPVQWHAFNLIRPNDLLNASAVRRVTTESMTGATSSQRVHTYLTIRVKSLDFDSQAGQLHVSGQIASENRYVKMGQYHTLDLELQRNFTLIKESTEDGWDSIARKQLEEAIDTRRGAEAVAVVMQEGLANIAFITPTQTILKQRVEVSIPKKRTGHTANHEKGLEKFFSTVLDTLLRQMEGMAPTASNSGTTELDSSTRPILIASPGFLAQSFLKHVDRTATLKASKPLLQLRKTMFAVHSSTGSLHSLSEVLSDPTVTAQLSDTKYARETALMTNFMDSLRRDDGRAWYGPLEVEKAVEKGAVGRGGGVLLISDKLFRAQEVATRRRWVTLVDRVRDKEGGEVRVLSSEHESGRRLEELSGVAAILTFPIMDLDEDEDEDEDKAVDDTSI